MRSAPSNDSGVWFRTKRYRRRFLVPRSVVSLPGGLALRTPEVAGLRPQVVGEPSGSPEVEVISSSLGVMTLMDAKAFRALTAMRSLPEGRVCGASRRKPLHRANINFALMNLEGRGDPAPTAALDAGPVEVPESCLTMHAR
ncbi:hypothetical protein BHM03_00017937 [Ensete ventricosum]|nr:hypothetical protein BHM03_00017937 [Ensete ventricosum]